VPRRDRHGEVCWRRPIIPAVTDMLKNPAYAGAFVYGRTRQQTSSGGRPQKSPRPARDWRIVVKDKYPAYIRWDTFEKIQIMLRDNRAEYLRTKSRGIPRDGAALLHGITWCGECGHKMFVRYKGGSQYVCNHLRQQHDVPVCQCLRAAPIDAQVAAAFLEAIAPAEIDALSRARKTQRRADDALRHAQEQQVQRLRYQAALAERQFNRVDPDNRLVAGELERRWEAALIELRRAEEGLVRSSDGAPVQSIGVDARLRAKVVALGERLPALGTVKMPVNALSALPRHAEMEQRVCELAAAGHYDDEIARMLTAEGHRSPWRGTEVLASTVRSIRIRHGVKVRQRTRWPAVSGCLTVTQLARRLQLPQKWIYTQLRRGALRTVAEPSGRYLFPDTEPAMQAIRELREHRMQRVDLTGGSA